MTNSNLTQLLKTIFVLFLVVLAGTVAFSQTDTTCRLHVSAKYGAGQFQPYHVFVGNQFRGSYKTSTEAFNALGDLREKQECQAPVQKDQQVCEVSVYHRAVGAPKFRNYHVLKLGNTAMDAFAEPTIANKALTAIRRSGLCTQVEI